MKKIISLLLCVALLACLLPVTADAADPKATYVYVGGVMLDATNSYYHNGVGGAAGTADTDSTGANATFDAANAKLTLNGLDIVADEVVFRTSTQKYGILANGDIEIILVGESNRILFSTDTVYTYAVNGIFVCSDDDSEFTGALTISGAGNLTIGSNACTCRDSSNGISAKTSVTMNGTGSLSVTAANSNEGHSAAVSAAKYTQTSGTVTLNAGSATDSNDNNFSCGLYANETVISGGTLTATGGSTNLRESRGIETGSCTISGTATVTATGGDMIESISIGGGSGGAIVIVGGGTVVSAGISIVGDTSILTVKDNATLIATGGNRTSSVGLCSKNTDSDAITFMGGEMIMKGSTQATNKAPGIADGVNPTAVASANLAGTPTVAYSSDNIAGYKYIRMAKVGITLGENTAFTKGGASGLVATVGHGLSGFTTDEIIGVWVGNNDHLLDENTDFTMANGGSVNITLLPAYLETLATGTYTLGVEHNYNGGGTLTINFTVTAPAGRANPSTGVSANMAASCKG